MSEIILCVWCGERVDDIENARQVTHVDFRGRMRERLLHAECSLRGVIGSLAHIERRCSCYGGSEDDPPGMTKREAAQAAVRAYFKRQGHRPS